jgi:hypothetical protein
MSGYIHEWRVWWQMRPPLRVRVHIHAADLKSCSVFDPDLKEGAVTDFSSTLRDGELKEFLLVCCSEVTLTGQEPRINNKQKINPCNSQW